MFYPKALPTGILVPATQSFSKCILGPTVIRCINPLPRTISAYANRSAFSSRLVDMHQCTPNIGDTQYFLCPHDEKRFIMRVERHDAFGPIPRLRLYHCEASASTQLGLRNYTGVEMPKVYFISVGKGSHFPRHGRKTDRAGAMYAQKRAYLTSSSTEKVNNGMASLGSLSPRASKAGNLCKVSS